MKEHEKELREKEEKRKNFERKREKKTKRRREKERARNFLRDNVRLKSPKKIDWRRYLKKEQPSTKLIVINERNYFGGNKNEFFAAIAIWFYLAKKH